MNEWMPDIKQSDILKNHSSFHKALYIYRNMPFPISDRELVICQSQFIIKERKGAMIIIRSVNEERQKHWQVDNMPPETPKTVRAEMVKGFMYVEEIDAENCWFHGFINVNPKLAVVPDWFINFIVKRVVNKVIINMRSKDMFDNDALRKRIEDNKEKFDKVR